MRERALDAKTLMPIFGAEDLLRRADTDGVFASTLLIPENILTLVTTGGDRIVRRFEPYFRQKRLEENRQMLADTLERQQLYSEEIIDAIREMPRDIALANKRFAYWNGVNVIRGSIAIPSPWLVASTVDAVTPMRGHRAAIFGLGGAHTALVMSYLLGKDGDLHVVEMDCGLVRWLAKPVADAAISPTRVHCADALGSLSSLHGRFDVVYATLSIDKVPPRWFDLLNDTGRIGAFVTVNGDRTGACEFRIFSREYPKGRTQISGLFNVRFSSKEAFDSNEWAEERVIQLFSGSTP